MSSSFQTVRGMRDFLPPQSRTKQFVEDVCRRVFELYGFEPVQTPVVESFELLSAKGSAGDAIRDEIYSFKDKGDRELGLRFDLTVPLGRVLATNPQLPKPFKRYQIATVYRYDRPQAKRYREFTQADADIAGVGGLEAEVECIQMLADVLRALELDFVIRINSRPVLEAIARNCNIAPECMADCFRSIDKQDKIGWAEIEAELKDKKIDTRIAKVLAQNDLKQVSKWLANNADWIQLQSLLKAVSEAGLSENIKLDLALARGLEYYTGTVFEVTAQNTTVAAGGRFDRLVQTYGGPSTPCVGISFGVDRLYDLVSTSRAVPVLTRVLVVALSSSQRAYAQQIARAFRSAGINCEMDLLNRNLSKNIEYAAKKGIAFVAIAGENEEKNSTISLKELSTKQQETLSVPNAVNRLANSH